VLENSHRCKFENPGNVNIQTENLYKAFNRNCFFLKEYAKGIPYHVIIEDITLDTT
jgi:hypothetical protein